MARHILGVVVLGLALNLARVSAQSLPSIRPLIGTWKFNAEKSTMGLSLPPRELTRTYREAGDGLYILTQIGLLADGTRTQSLYVGRDDGREYPLSVSGADLLPAAYISITPIDAFTAEQRERVNEPGEFQSTGVLAIRKVSADGKTLTLTVKAPAVDRTVRSLCFVPEIAGSEEVDYMVFDKQ
jgi:hypothetical protein